MMLQKIEAYAFNNRLEIIRTHESRMLEIDKFELIQKKSGVRMSSGRNRGKHTQSGDSDKLKGRFVDLYV